MNLIRKGFDKLLSFGCIILETIGIKCMVAVSPPCKDNTIVAFSHFFLFFSDFSLCLPPEFRSS